MHVALQQSATDPRTGTIDMDLIQTGVSAAARKQQQELATTIRNLLSGAGGANVTVRQLLEQLNAARLADDPHAAEVTMAEVREAIAQLTDAEFLLPTVGDVVRVRAGAQVVA